jgi:Epoxide hydrolase N terminus
MSGTTEESAGARAIRPFTTEIPESEIEALRARIGATRWPEKETVPDQSQGVQLETMRELARYWATDYNWRTCEAKLNNRNSFPKRSAQASGRFARCPVAAALREAAGRAAARKRGRAS